MLTNFNLRRNRNIPASGCVGCAVDGVGRADAEAEPAAFAGDRIDAVGHADEVVARTVQVDRVEVAGRGATAASKAFRRADRALGAAGEIVDFSDGRCEQQMQVGRVDVVVRQDLHAVEPRERSDDGGLPRSTLAADDRDLPIV